jgi:hypothetical protein
MDVSLRLITDAGSFKTATAECSSDMDKLSDKTDQFAKTSKKNFEAPTKEISDLGKEINNGAKKIKEFSDETKKVGNSANAVKELKKQIKEYTSEAFKAGAGTKAFSDNLQKAGQLKDELADLNAQVKALSGNIGENLAKAAGNSLSLVARGFEGISSVSILTGNNTKEFEETLLKLQAFNGLANLANEFAGIGDKLTEIKEGFKPVLTLFTSGASSVVSGYGAANETLKGFFTNFSGNAKSAFKTGISSVKDFGSNAGSVAKNVGSSFVSFFSNFGANMKSFAASAKSGIGTIGTAIKANPLGIILTVVVAITAAFALLTDKFKPLTKIFSGIGDAIADVGKEIEKFAQSLGLMASEEEKRAENFIKNTQKEVDAIKEKFDFEIKLVKASGKETVDMEIKKQDAVFKRASLTIDALTKIRKEEGKLSEDQKKQLEEAQKLEKESFQEKILIQATFAKEQRDKAKEEADKAAKEAKERADKAKAEAEKNAKDLADALADLAKKSDQAVLSGLSGQARLDFIRNQAIEELKILEDTLIKKGKLTNRNFKLNEEQERELASIKTEINRQYYTDTLALQIDAANKEAQIIKSNADNDLAVLELRNTIAKNNVDKVKSLQGSTNMEIEAFEEEKNKSLLQLELKYQEEKLQLTINEIDAEAKLRTIALQGELESLKGKNDAASKARSEAIGNEIQQIASNSELGKQAAISSTENIVAGIKETLDKVKPESLKIDWAKLLGISDAELQVIQDNLQKAGKAVTDIINAQYDSKQQEFEREQELLDKRKQINDDETNDLENQLKDQQALRDEGFANNVQQLQDELAAKKKERDLNLEQEKKLHEEEKKLAKQKLLLNTATQASSLATAIAEVFASTASSGPVGVAIGIATIGAMLASFAISVGQASAAVNAANKEGFYKGGYTGDGGKYDEAGTVHKGEFVHTKEKTKKHRSLLEGIHKDDDRLIHMGILDLIKDRGISLIGDIPNEINNTKNSIRNNEMRMFVNNNAGVESRIDNLEKHLSTLVKQGNESEIILANGTRIIKKGNVTTTIRKS